MLVNSLIGDNLEQKGVFACFYLQIGIKKEWLSHDNQSSVNLKSNTMKNTMQRYGFFAIVQYFRDGISDFLLFY